MGYFDPMGMSKDGDVKTFRRRREAELKNGRVAMFATMGCWGLSGWDVNVLCSRSVGNLLNPIRFSLQLCFLVSIQL